MKKIITAIAIIGFVLGSIAIWSCNNGGGEETPCNGRVTINAGDSAVIEITGTRDFDGKYLIKKLDGSDTRTAAATASLTFACD